MLDRQQARQIAVRAQLLDAWRPDSLVATVDHLTLLQIDPTAAIAPNVDLVAWSRLGAGYAPSDLRFCIETERSLVEHSSYVRPMDDVGLVLATLPHDLHPRVHDWLAANAGFRADVLARLDADGPQTAAAIPDTCQVPWASSGWNNDKNVNRLLEMLTLVGDVAISGRQGKLRTYDLPERVYPTDIRVPTHDAARAELDAKADRKAGVLRVHAVHEDFPWDPEIGDAVEAEVQALADWLGLEVTRG